MGGTSSSSQTQSSSLAPYNPASGTLNGLLGTAGTLAGNISATPNATQTGAINQIVSNSNGQPNYNPAISSGTLGLLNGGGANNNNGAISGNLGLLNSNIGATASGANVGNDPALAAQLQGINTGITNSVNGTFAASGRDGSTANQAALGTAITNADAPVIANQYNQDRQNQLNAANTLYGAGNSTYGMLNANQANANTNFTNGVGTVSAGLNAENAAPNSTLAAESQMFGIPISQLTTLLGAVSPVAAQFGTQNGTASGTNTMSGAQQFGVIANGIGSLMPKGPMNFGTQNFGAP